MALAPGILATIVLIAGVAAVGSDFYTVIRFVVSILALIVAVFAWQARHWWWLLVLAPIAVIWNPVMVIPLERDLLLVLHYVAALVFIAAGILIKIRNTDDRNAR